MTVRLHSLPLLCLLAISFLSLSGCGGGPSNPSGSAAASSGPGGASVQVAPVVASISPASTNASAKSLDVRVDGSNFTAASAIQAAGVSLPTIFVSATELAATVPGAQLAAGGSVPITVVDGKLSSASTPLTIQKNAPTLGNLAPRSILVRSPSTQISVTGTNFSATSNIRAGGVILFTTYVSDTQLTATVAASQLALVGNLAVDVIDGTVTSTLASLAITPSPLPSATTVSPNTLYSGSPDTLVTIFGTNFNASCTPQLGGAALPVNTQSASTLSTTIPAANLAAKGTLSLTVACALGTTNPVTLTVADPPAPTIATYQGGFAVPIRTATTLTIQGNYFTPRTVVQINGTPVDAQISYGSTITVNIPADLLTTPGNYSLSIVTPAPGGGAAGPLLLTGYVGLPNNSMIYSPSNGLFYLSVPSSAGSPYANSVVSVDPATGAVGSPILVGSEPNHLAISSDGKVLWVTLDGAGAVRKVDLTTGTAGYQFSLSNSLNNYQTANALAALPGSPDSVVVATGLNFGSRVQIFDAGVGRGTPVSPLGNFSNNPFALQVDGSKGQIYAANSGSYWIYTYDASGLTQKITANGSFAGNNSDDLQLVAGSLYTVNGKVYDSEAGTLLGTFYNSAIPSSSSTSPVVATGPTIADTAAGKAFILDSTSSYSYGTPNQIQSFNLSDYTLNSATIPVNINNGSSNYSNSTSRLTRWGTDGLAFRAGSGLYSFRSGIVKDLSSTKADLGVTLANSGSTTTGSGTTYTATVKNTGPATATGAVLTGIVPASGILVSVTPSQGFCSASNVVLCNLGSLANGGIATVSFVVTQTAPGSAVLIAQVAASEQDTNPANNQASVSAAVTGVAYAPSPTIVSISPVSVKAGAGDTVLTVKGLGFISGSTVVFNGANLSTTFANSTQLTATVPSAQLAALGWGAVGVSNPAPGGGSSNVTPFTIYTQQKLGLGRVLYDPFTRKLYAGVTSGTSSLTGNSIAAITPETGTVGSPVSIGSQPAALALSSDGSWLYTSLTGSNSIARFNMRTQQTENNYALPASPNPYTTLTAPASMAVQPGSPNTVAFSINGYSGTQIFDFDGSAKTMTVRGPISSGCCFYIPSGTPGFLNATDLFLFSNSYAGHCIVGPAGLVPTPSGSPASPCTSYSLNSFSDAKISGGMAFASTGGVARLSPTAATPLGVLPHIGNSYYYGQAVEPDAAVNRVFFSASTLPGYSPDGIIGYDLTSFLPTSIVSLNMQANEAQYSNYSVVDLIRWGQDGLAALTSTGNLYLLRGPVVIPELLNANSAATLTSLSTSTLATGTGNTVLTVTGSGFIRGAAASLNGSYRTTTWVDAGHLSVAIPAVDLAAPGSASLTVTNPGAPASGSLSLTIQ